MENSITDDMAYKCAVVDSGSASDDHHITVSTCCSFENLHFDNLVLRSLPLDPQLENYVRQVEGACFSRIHPDTVDNPEMVVYSTSAMSLLNIPESELLRPEAVEYFSGNKLLPGSETAAHCYCGHQFGNFAGQLGDGAAVYLGEILNHTDERWEIQLKGAGRTPYSRTADGRKVLRSSIREFLMSEAMHFLRIPTNRTGTCVTSDTEVIRDIYYDGHPIQEKCTLILRIAPTFLRFGSFEIFKPMDKMTGRKGPSVGRKDVLVQMLDYTIQTFYPEIWCRNTSHDDTANEVMYVAWFHEVVKRTARLVAQWQCVGWCHGVLNTDNMSIVGITIDYGPYGFMERYDPDFVCNASDNNGRYSYESQPSICEWNCKTLAEAIQDAVPLEKTLSALDTFNQEYELTYISIMRKKLGLFKACSEDSALVADLLDTMHRTGADFTNSFRCLRKVSLPGMTHLLTEDNSLDYLLTQCCSVEDLRYACRSRMDPSQLQMLMILMQTNPALLEQLPSGYQMVSRELEMKEKSKQLKDLTDEMKTERDRKCWSEWLTKYKERLKQEAGDHGDVELEELNRKRVELMNSNNPRVILRNYIAQNAIEAAEKGDYSEVRELLKVLEHPYDDGPTSDISKETKPKSSLGGSNSDVADSSCVMGSRYAYDERCPDSARGLRVT